MYKEIGGYFGLELNKHNNYLDNVIALNTARNCLRYVIKVFNIKEIYVPYYTCSAVVQAIKTEDCKIRFYHIDNNFMPVNSFKNSSYILYTNYFGVCAKNVIKLAKQYKNLIVDNSQAFYMPQYGLASFNSLRKFFGVSDGAALFTKTKVKLELEKDTSYQRCSHLLKRLDVTASFAYSDFKKNEDSLIEEPIKEISNLTKRIFENIDIELVKEKRLKNFKMLANILDSTNELNLCLEKEDVPMVYPYLVKSKNLKEKLIKDRIYTATYWDKLPDKYPECYFQKYIVPLPIDQRYEKEDMQMILDILCKK